MVPGVVEYCHPHANPPEEFSPLEQSIASLTISGALIEGSNTY